MEKRRQQKRLVVGISGASGAILGIQLLKAMQRVAGWETHLVISGAARRAIAQETAYSIEQIISLSTKCYELDDVDASIASGTFKSEGMAIVPCSMKTLAGIASGYSDNLLLRAADVILKERHRLVLVARESPFSAIHLRNMLTVVNAGAILLPAILSFYQRPQTIEDLVHHIVGKILDLFDVEIDGSQRWSSDARNL